MTIKEVAKKTGVSADTLRYYERIGLLPGYRRALGSLSGAGRRVRGRDRGGSGAGRF